MRVATGRVLKSGRIEIDRAPLQAGTRVAVVVSDERWQLDKAGTKKLLRALGQSRRGEVFDADEVLAELSGSTADQPTGIHTVSPSR